MRSGLTPSRASTSVMPEGGGAAHAAAAEYQCQSRASLADRFVTVVVMMVSSGCRWPSSGRTQALRQSGHKSARRYSSNSAWIRCAKRMASRLAPAAHEIVVADRCGRVGELGALLQPLPPGVAVLALRRTSAAAARAACARRDMRPGARPAAAASRSHLPRGARSAAGPPSPTDPRGRARCCRAARTPRASSALRGSGCDACASSRGSARARRRRSDRSPRCAAAPSVIKAADVVAGGGSCGDTSSAARRSARLGCVSFSAAYLRSASASHC